MKTQINRFMFISILMLFILHLSSFCWAMNTVIRETDKKITDLQADNGQVVWIETNLSAKLSSLYLYNGKDIIPLYENYTLQNAGEYKAMVPQLNNGQVIWHVYENNSYRLYLYNGETIKPITDKLTLYRDLKPHLCKGKIVYEELANGGSAQIYPPAPHKGNDEPPTLFFRPAKPRP